MAFPRLVARVGVSDRVDLGAWGGLELDLPQRRVRMTQARRTRNRGRQLAALAIIGTCGSWQTLTAATPSSSGQAAQRVSLSLTYVANSGVLVGSGETKVLIDALFDKPGPEYRAPAPEVLGRLMEGAPPYDGVDLVLATHDHPDHFDASLAVRYLEGLEGPRLAAPADAVEKMRAAAADWARIEPRIVSLDLPLGGKADTDFGSVKLTAFRTLHGQQDSPMNMMYLVEVGGWRIFHEGDSPGVPEDSTIFRWGDTRGDLALVHFWFPLDPDGARFLQEVLRPDHIALTHLPVRLEGDAPGKIDLVRQYYRDIFLLLPGMPVRTFDEPAAAAYSK
jgi:L-ascorbate metabolism protein UlaG (beta-lactamase superfamily)